MNIIHCPTLSIIVSESSVTQTVKAFVEELVSRNPFILDRIYSYMAQDYLPNNPNASSHIVAKRRDAWVENGYAHNGRVNRLAELKNGWYLLTNADPSMFAKAILQRIEEVLRYGGADIKIYAYLKASGRPGIRYYTEEDIKHFDSILTDEETVTEEQELPERRISLKKFWDQLIEYNKSRADSSIVMSHKTNGSHWYNVSFGSSNYHFSFNRLSRPNIIRCLIWIRDNKQVFDAFLADRERIEAITGPLLWNRCEGKKASHIDLETEYTTDSEAFKWLIDNAIKFNQAFGKQK